MSTKMKIISTTNPKNFEDDINQAFKNGYKTSREVELHQVKVYNKAESVIEDAIRFTVVLVKY